MTKSFYKDHAAILFQNGYKPIPIKPKSKIPFMAKGESWKVDINQARVDTWAMNGKGHGGIALTGLCGIDCDVKDKDISNRLLRYIRENISKNTLIRVGQKPKFLIPASPQSAVTKKHKNTWYDQDGIKHEIEFLSPNDQYFLAFGIHPDTEEPFTWLKDRSPLNTKIDDLDVWDDLDISAFEDEFDAMCEEAGFTRDFQVDSKHIKKKPPSGGGFENLKPPGEMSDPAGLAELTSWLDMLPVEWVDDRDNWITIGAAIHHETGGTNDGWVLFDNWSQKSKKYKDRKDTIERWESFSDDRGFTDGGGCSTRGTIIHVLQEAGVWDKAKKSGESERGKVLDVQGGAKCSESVSDVIAEMNKKHAVIRIGSKIRIMNEGKSIDGGLDLGFLSVPDFNTMYRNRVTPDPKDPKKSKIQSAVWLCSPLRREYKGIVFEPTGSSKSGAELEGYYNIWKGLSVKPKRGDWGLFRNHIYNVIADGNEVIGNWVIAWVARIVQSPGGPRPGTSIVLRGGQGTGKGVYVNTIGELFGDHFLPVSHASQVAGRFNSHLTNKILVFIDEGFWAGDKKAEGVLKSIITEPNLAIEQKGVDIIRVKNNINLIMASNNDWVVPANMQERRFCVLDVSDRHQGDKAYFNAVMRQMHRNGGLAAMLYDMLKMDLSGIELGKFEQTKGLYEQKIHSMPTEMQYWHDRLQDGEILSYIDDESDFSNYVGETVLWGKVSSKDQHNDYLRFADKMKERYPLSPTEFGIFIKNICPRVSIFKKREGTKSTWCRKFPQLDECRAEFASQLKYNIEWDIEDEEEKPLF